MITDAQEGTIAALFPRHGENMRDIANHLTVPDTPAIDHILPAMARQDRARETMHQLLRPQNGPKLLYHHNKPPSPAKPRSSNQTSLRLPTSRSLITRPAAFSLPRPIPSLPALLQSCSNTTNHPKHVCPLLPLPGVSISSREKIF